MTTIYAKLLKLDGQAYIDKHIGRVGTLTLYFKKKDITLESVQKFDVNIQCMYLIST